MAATLLPLAIYNSTGIFSIVLLQNITITASELPVISSSIIFNTIKNGTSEAIQFENVQSVPKSGPQFERISNRMQPIMTDEKLISSLCPGNISSLIRYDKEEKKCSEIGFQSHCGKQMIFYSFNESIVYGHCDCDQSTSIPLIYHTTDRNGSRCSFVYQQAYCKENEWLEIERKSGIPKCVLNKCYNSGRSGFGNPPLASRDLEPEYVPFNGTGECVKLGQRYKKCTRSQIVSFNWPQRLYAECHVPEELVIKPKLLSVPSLNCAPGSYLTHVGRCQYSFDFD